jgi:hypothetical protein
MHRESNAHSPCWRRQLNRQPIIQKKRIS